MEGVCLWKPLRFQSPIIGSSYVLATPNFVDLATLLNSIFSYTNAPGYVEHAIIFYGDDYCCVLFSKRVRIRFNVTSRYTGWPKSN